MSEAVAVSQSFLSTVEEMAGKGLTNDQIAYNLGMTPSYFSKRMKENQQIAISIAKGRSESTFTVASALYDSALNNNVQAQIFYLKSVGGYMEEDKRQFLALKREELEFKKQVAGQMQESSEIIFGGYAKRSDEEIQQEQEEIKRLESKLDLDFSPIKSEKFIKGLK